MPGADLDGAPAQLPDAVGRARPVAPERLWNGQVAGRLVAEYGVAGEGPHVALHLSLRDMAQSLQQVGQLVADDVVRGQPSSHVEADGEILPDGDAIGGPGDADGDLAAVQLGKATQAFPHAAQQRRGAVVRAQRARRSYGRFEQSRLEVGHGRIITHRCRAGKALSWRGQSASRVAPGGEPIHHEGARGSGDLPGPRPPAVIVHVGGQMSRRHRSPVAAGLPVILLLAALAAAGCQNWDLKRPDAPAAGDADRSFTPLGEDTRSPLTSDVAWRRLDAIEAASGERRVELVETFLGEFPEARRIARVHRLAGEAWLATEQPGRAADAFERALVLTRTDVLGLPLETDLPLQLGMARLQAGQIEDGIEWLVRTGLADHGPRVQQALRWAHAEHGAEQPFAVWLEERRQPLLTGAPEFSLPGLQQERVALAEVRGKATLINFWSPT